LGFKGEGKWLHLYFGQPEETYAFFIFTKSSKWFNKIEDCVPWQEELGCLCEENKEIN